MTHTITHSAPWWQCPACGHHEKAETRPSICRECGKVILGQSPEERAKYKSFSTPELIQMHDAELVAIMERASADPAHGSSKDLTPLGPVMSMAGELEDRGIPPLAERHPDLAAWIDGLEPRLGGEHTEPIQPPRPAQYRHWNDVYPGRRRAKHWWERGGPINPGWWIEQFFPDMIEMFSDFIRGLFSAEAMKHFNEKWGPARPAPGAYTTASGSGTGIWWVLCDQGGAPFTGATHFPHGLTDPEYAEFIASGRIDANTGLLT